MTAGTAFAVSGSVRLVRVASANPRGRLKWLSVSPAAAVAAPPGSRPIGLRGNRLGQSGLARRGVGSVAVEPDGDFVVVWQSDGSTGSDSSYHSIQGQRYASNGTPLGGEFQVNSYTTQSQMRSSVSTSEDGDVVVVWQSGARTGSDSSSYSIQGQRFASNGTPLGAEFQVNTYTPSVQHHPAVSVDPLGRFIVAWQSNGSSGSDILNRSVQGQRYLVPSFDVFVADTAATPTASTAAPD